MENYEIYNLNLVEEEAMDISSTNKELKTVIEEINEIILYLTEYWVNESGADINSSISNLKVISRNLEENIVPLYDKISSVLIDVIGETRTVQSKNLNN